MVTLVTKRRYGAGRCGGGGRVPLCLGKTAEGSVGRRVSKVPGARGLACPNAVEL